MSQMNVIGGLKRYYDIAGPRGVLAMSSFRLLRRPAEICVRPGGFRNPLYLRLGTTDPSVLGEIMGGEYDFDLPFVPRVIVDAGANIGVTSAWFATKYPDAKIIAVEAEKSNFDLLARNVRDYRSIVPVHAALWNRDGHIVVAQPDSVAGASGNWAFITRDDGEGERIRAVTLGTLMKELNIPAIDLAKIDIEGAEQEVFEDTRWLNGLKALMIELHDRFRPGCAATVESALKDFEHTHQGFTNLYLRNQATADVA